MVQLPHAHVPRVGTGTIVLHSPNRECRAVGAQGRATPKLVASCLAVNIGSALRPARTVVAVYTHMPRVGTGIIVLKSPNRDYHAVEAQGHADPKIVTRCLAVNIGSALRPARTVEGVYTRMPRLGTGIFVLISPDRDYHAVEAQGHATPKLVAYCLAINIGSALRPARTVEGEYTHMRQVSIIVQTSSNRDYRAVGAQGQDTPKMVASCLAINIGSALRPARTVEGVYTHMPRLGTGIIVQMSSNRDYRAVGAQGHAGPKLVACCLAINIGSALRPTLRRWR